MEKFGAAFEVKKIEVEANGFTFATLVCGDSTGKPVMLLHGFPEPAAMWVHLMQELSKYGFYVVAPNQRGYSRGARPAAVSAYQIKYLIEDVLSIANALMIGKFHLVGHDWGSVVGWQLAANDPNCLWSYTALSVPHLDAFARAYQEDSAQYQASSYIRNFQMPGVAEQKLSEHDFARLKSIWTKQTDAEIDAYLEVFRSENALSAAINWYRANFDLLTKGVNLGQVALPVLFFWGSDDTALLRSGAEWTGDYVKGVYRFVELRAGHWLVQEAYHAIKEEMIDFFETFQD